MILNSQNLTALFKEQLACWEQAKNNYDALNGVLVKDVEIDGFKLKVQFNPARIISSSAKVDSNSIKERKCFLCRENRPQVQKGLEFINEGDIDNPYTVLINPFPIFPKHLTIPLLGHTDQLILGRFDAMLNLSRELEEYTLFYNGPKCGASAPDHFHFQAGNKGFLTIENQYSNLNKEKLFDNKDAKLFSVKSIFKGLFSIESSCVQSAVEVFEKIYSVLPIKEGEMEPMMNILSWYEGGNFITLIYVRDKHRPHHYFAEGDSNILLSPASVDMGGVFITPLEKDYAKISKKEIREIIDEICIDEQEENNIINKLKDN